MSESIVRSASASRCLPPTDDTGGGAVLDLDQAAKIAGTSAETVRRWAIQRSIGVQEGRAWRIDREKLNRFIGARSVFRGDVPHAPIKRATIQLRAPEPLKEAIETAAKSAGVTPSEFVRLAIVDWLVAAGFAPEARRNTVSSDGEAPSSARPNQEDSPTGDLA